MSVSISDDQREAARRIAEQITDSTGRRGGWREVRELLNEFGVDRFSREARQKIELALEDAGLITDPPLRAVDRRGTVSLTTNKQARSTDEEQVEAAPLLRDALKDVVAVREWGADRRLQRPSLPTVKPQYEKTGVRWFDIRDARTVRPGQVHAALNELCRGELTRAMVDDLLSPDPRPGIKQYGDHQDIRVVSAFRVNARESDVGVEQGSCSKAGVLDFMPVELLVGDSWLVTCWQERDIYRGASRVAEDEPHAPDRLYEEVERCWATGANYSSAGDLAVLVLHELALTYAPARRQLYVWLEEWELDFYRSEHVDRETLLEVRGCAAVLRDWLSALNPSGMRQDQTKAWFPGITGTAEGGPFRKALDVDTRVDQSLADLRAFTDEVRGAFDLLQLRETERQREHDETFQRTVSVGGAAILIPTLIAGIAGSNTWIPGESPSHWSFFLLLVLIVLGAVTAWVGISRLHHRTDRL